MACTDGSCSTGTGITCGTGGWNGPKPGDPDNNSVLSAIPAYGGIDLSWTLPTTNSHAVSYINIFRGNTDNPDLAVRRNTASGSYYYDKIPSDEIREYFYWIQFVSINGTYGELIGPASATPKASISEVIAELTGRINESVLSEALRTKLGEINLLHTSLNEEINARLLENATVINALTAVQSETGQALTLLNQEVLQRTSADESLLNSVNTLAVGMGDNAAAIANEALLRADGDSAVALQISTVQTTLNGQIAGVETVMGAAIQDLEQTTDALGAQYTVKLTANGLIGGFGTYNDGTTVQAGFDVDTFWVGRNEGNTLKPFVVDGETVFLSNTVVPTIQSTNYEPGVAGWKIRKDGPAEFQDIIIRGTGTFSGDLNAAGGTFAGSLSAATGTFAGSLTAGTVDMSMLMGETHIYSTPGTYTLTIPADKSSIRLTVIGGGGGGGSGGNGRDDENLGGYGGGGGGAGQSVTGTFNNVSGTVTIVVGAGGAGGIGSSTTGEGNAGSNGASSYVSGFLSAAGGTGGGSGKWLWRYKSVPAFQGSSTYVNKWVWVDPTTENANAGGSIGGVTGSKSNKIYIEPGAVYIYGGAGGAGGSSGYGAVGVGGAGANDMNSVYSAQGGHGGTGAGGGGGGGGSSSPFTFGHNGGNGGNGKVIVEFYNPNAVVLQTTFNNMVAKYNQLCSAVGRSDLQFNT